MSKIAVIGIIVEDTEQSEVINRTLSDYGKYIVGRMGVPYRERDINIISVILDAPLNVINSLSGKIGALSGVSTKTIYSKEFNDDKN